MTYLHLDKRQIFLKSHTLALQRFPVFPRYHFVAKLSSWRCEDCHRGPNDQNVPTVVQLFLFLHDPRPRPILFFLNCSYIAFTTLLQSTSFYWGSSTSIKFLVLIRLTSLTSFTLSTALVLDTWRVVAPFTNPPLYNYQTRSPASTPHSTPVPGYISGSFATKWVARSIYLPHTK